MGKPFNTRRGGGPSPADRPAFAQAPRDHYQEVTDRVVAALEAGTLPWRRPWVSGHRATVPGMPRNAISGRTYRGVNAVLLAMTQFVHASEDPRWLTYLQAAEHGCQVRRGERGTTVVFFKRLEVHGRDREDDAEGEGMARRVPMLRSFTVFHATQVDGLPEYQAPTPEAAPWRKPDAVDVIVAASGVRVRFGGDRAAYSPVLDVIAMPPPAAFRTSEDFGATLLHELGHASGHESRLARDLSGRFGSRPYSYEELVAELISLMVGSVVGLSCDVENHASYLQSWLDVMREDRRAIFRAAAAAQKAADWMLALYPDYAKRVGEAGAGCEADGAPEALADPAQIPSGFRSPSMAKAA